MTSAIDELSGRQKAVLRAVAAGRCRAGLSPTDLEIDKRPFCDQSVGTSLIRAGLIALRRARDENGAQIPHQPFRLTELGQHALNRTGVFAVAV